METRIGMLNFKKKINKFKKRTFSRARKFSSSFPIHKPLGIYFSMDCLAKTSMS